MIDESAASFGDLLREFRLQSALSQEQLAAKAGISEAAVSALERGVRKAPYRGTVTRLAEALKLSEAQTDRLQSARRVARSKPDAVHNLTASRTSLLGRDAELESVSRLFHRSRLVTIVGSGGVGKTRVAIEAARRMLGNPWNEAWFVDLSAVMEGNFIASKIAASIVPPLAAGTTIDDVAASIGGRRMILILDNCEQVVESVARAVDLILERCPGTALLTTSREPLGVAGEFVYRLPSLELEPAIALFLERVEAVAPHWIPGEKERAIVRDIVRRLDGIPLAIELAAAQQPLLGLETLQNRLVKEFRIPPGRRDLPARQQTVMATIQWSYDLLADREREVLRNVSIFAGTFSLEGVEAVLSRDANDSSLASSVSALTSRSLLNVATIDGRARYSLLESVRAFGFERLREAGSYDKLARGQAEWLAACSESVNPDGLRYREVDRYLIELDNIRSTLAWSLDSSSLDDRAIGARIIMGFGMIWEIAGLDAEHRRWLELAIDRIDEARYTLTVAKLLRYLVHRCQYRGELLDVASRAARVAQQAGDALELVRLHAMLTGIYATCDRFEDAERSATIVEELRERAAVEYSTSLNGAFLSNRSFLRMRQGRLEEARSDSTAGLTIARAVGDDYGVVESNFRLSNIAYLAGDLTLALDYAERVRNDNPDRPNFLFRSLRTIAVLNLLLGKLDQAREALRQLLGLYPGREGDNAELEYAALLLVLTGDVATGARIFGFVRAWEERSKPNRLMARKEAYEILSSSLQRQLSGDDLSAATTAGAKLTYADISSEVLAAVESA